MQEIIQLVLKKNQLNTDLPYTQYFGGQINDTFLIGDLYVLKVEKDLDVLKHQPEIIELGIQAGAKIPKIIDSGVVAGKQYLLMEKIQGNKLSASWLAFSDYQKENFIVKIAEQLKILHSVHFKKYSPQRPREFDNLKDSLEYFTKKQTEFVTKDNKTFDARTTENISFVRNYFDENISKLNETGTAVFVHNDLHFENIMYQDDTITGLIDFDFARQAPRDYELWHLLDFFNTPVYYVEKKLEDMWKKYEMGNEIQLFKKYYPELFAHPDLATRLKLYFMDQIFGDLQWGAIDKFNQKADQYFRTDWLDRVVVNS